MAWFKQAHYFEKSHLKLAHITDSHLFAHRKGLYFDVNTADNLRAVLSQLALQQLDAVVFGGDLTQDHTIASYTLFATLVSESDLTCPVFWLPGNHDELDMLEHMSQGQIQTAKRLYTDAIDILLLNSKGPTPAGWCDEPHLADVIQALNNSASKTLVFCHHHPVPIDGYLDKHMLENGPQLLNILVESECVMALIHGHVHNEYHLRFRELDIFATPATSIQFTKGTALWQQQDLGPAWRLITIEDDTFSTEVVWLNG
ncbi:3',5'-cyclic adenosine monophosphate phosphodiesterase CpdA [Pseudoalteromonas holothuriae]|uniref:3',5'-cyclic adenosine monophosphate phosphodiesterase CpdA n=1 Tax=Pseudoalteromonas holothuriae TaxID=2963714 RepID=A0A9W4VPT3_9GAMM|nr:MULTISPECIES: metallophosphoesterase [unclassified Pseudoalteromonas]CAH9053594.1 3',5'-cyclic adenosine monophosphate phosphodiesterase CpdA [Pseudoalteromonas sp. CIP111951]CAH9055955.1 3',5'-cyclic adenosine monophosphate phosphodiesterase CpdA [Pseudoalteromonas sp. CIP111854]